MGYVVGTEVQVDGPRGKSNVFTIGEDVGNGWYRLRDGSKLLPKLFAEEDLIKVRRT